MTMRYRKPAVEILGEARKVIESINPQKPPMQPFDFPGVRRAQPAYDLDE